MNVSIINIGDELLIGQVVNTNASKMSQMLVSAGMEVVEVATIGDDGDAIEQTLRRCLAFSDAVLVTGGLGPTKDDITKNKLCELFHSRLVENAEALANVKRIFDARGYELTPINRQQAWVPECCIMVNNILGTAPCMWFDVNGASDLLPHPDGRSRVVVSMPGVPFEMINLMETEIVPRLRSHFHCSHILNKTLLVQGIGESFLSDMIEPWELALPKSIRLAYLPQAGMLRLRLTARGEDQALLQNQIDKAVEELYPIAGQYIVGEDLQTLPELVAHTLSSRGLTLASAESCTGGAIASRLTALPGASTYFKGAIVSYCNEAKEHLLGVSHDTLETHTAVSEATVKEMAQGARRQMNVDYAVATTGVAGPTGGTNKSPVGTVWMAIAGPHGVEAKCMKYGDRREQTIDRACNEVFSMIVKTVREDQTR